MAYLIIITTGANDDDPVVGGSFIEHDFEEALERLKDQSSVGRVCFMTYAICPSDTEDSLFLALCKA